MYILYTHTTWGVSICVVCMYMCAVCAVCVVIVVCICVCVDDKLVVVQQDSRGQVIHSFTM